MTANDLPNLLVTADLRLEVDDLRAQIRGNGSDLLVTADHPIRLARAAAAGLGGSGLRRTLAEGAAALASSGLSITLAGPAGGLVTVGDAADSPAAGLVVGTRRVRLHPRVWAALGAAAVPVLVVTVAVARRAARSRG